MFLDLQATRPVSEIPLRREAALGRSDWASAAAAIEREAGVCDVTIHRLLPAPVLAQPAAPGELLASRAFQRRWRHVHGEALPLSVLDHRPFELSLLEREGIEERLRERLAQDGVLRLAIDSEQGFHAVAMSAQDLKVFSPWRLLDHLQELSLAAAAADEVRAAQQELVLRLLDLGHTAAFVIDTRGWVRSENASARDLMGQVLHFPAKSSDEATSSPGGSVIERGDLSSHFRLGDARQSPYAVQTPSGRRLIVYAAPWGLEKSVFQSGDEMLVAWDVRTDAPLLSLSGERLTDELRAALRSTFGLTKMESLLAVQLLGSDLRSAAEDCGMAYETARSHLKSMFGRMKVRSQGELTALLARFAYHERLRRMLAAA